MQKFNIATEQGTALQGVLFSAQQTDTVMIAITGIHGNFYSNPFYYNISETLSANGIDFIYAPTRNAFGQIDTVNHLTGKPELIGSFNEDFRFAEQDVKAYVDYAATAGYRHIILAGHSLGANKVIYYLAKTQDLRIQKFILLSPANIPHLISVVTPEQRAMVADYLAHGRGQELLPFELLGWLPCVADTADQWLHSPILNNVHLEESKDFSQIEQISHTGAFLIGTFDRFTDGDPSQFLRTINRHFPNHQQNKLIFIENTGHTYQQKEQEVADRLLALIQDWQA